MKKNNFIIHLIIVSVSILLSGCSEKKGIPPQSMICMDTVCSINAFDDGTEELYNEIFARLGEIEKTFSPTLTDSEICKVNKMAGISPVEVSKDFIEVLETAQKISRITTGALDVTAGPLIDLWGINTDHAKIPSRTEIQEAQKLVGYEKIQIEGNKVYLPLTGMSLNFGAVVKGYATDEVVSILRNHNVKKAVIDLGGNICTFGKKDGNLPWIIGIKNPKAPEENPLLKIYIKETSVVTSGIYERYFEKDGKRYHHILDTKTGFPAESGLSSVTVICKKSIVADCLSTAFFVMGKEKAIAVIPQIEEEFNTQIPGVFITSNNQWSSFGKIKVKPYSETN